MSEWTVKESLKSGSTTLESGKAIHKRAFYVKLKNSPGNQTAQAARTDGIPQIGSLHPSGDGTTVSRVEAKLLDESNSKELYFVTVDYSPNGTSDSNTKESSKPWEKDSLFSFDFRTYQRILEKDYSEVPKTITNSAGDMFENPLMEDVVEILVTVTRARKSYDFQYAFIMKGSTCPSGLSIQGAQIPAGCAKLLSWSGSEAVYTDKNGKEEKYYNEKIELLLSSKAEETEILDCGFQALDSSGKKFRITTGDNKPVVVAQLLDGTGKVLAKDKPAVFRTFKTARRASSWGPMLPL